MIKTLSSRLVYENPWSKLYEDEIEMESGYKGIYGYIVRPDGACAAVINQKQEILLVRQYRYPIKQWQWGVPGGGVDQGETLEQGLKREILEEAGYKVEVVTKLGATYPLSSLATEKDNIFLCKALNRAEKEVDGEDDEIVAEVKFFSFKEALCMIDEGEITDATTSNVIQMAYRYLQNNQII